MYRCAAGVGRTTLHKRYPTRADLVRAVASEALDLVDEAISGVDLGTDDAVDQLIARLVPLGPRVEFLLRFPNLQDDERLSTRLNTTDQPVIDLISRLQSTRLRAGRLAPLDAPRLVLTTFYQGVSHVGAVDRP